ncbi:hypothetical protein CONLIGDRAFT_644130 [Coniochaeta ligniaria NRRL 30616]|uniref:F-box domain-containing protein n=1 Tax=Coniochaeta ligniaria NRRL 30616 TaxID=1408157 RepID=A0A1J7IRL2_9PEZI|nr:hypothetical protein CONLIGDRAFT_644130 [Coniochaeta ligniaria NRRL 30616]
MMTHHDPPLTRLPMEVLDEIVSYLSVEYFVSLRLTCKTVERALFRQFSRRFFETRQCLFPNKYNLQTLLDISTHPALSEALQHVIIATDRSIFSNTGGIEHITHLPKSFPWWISRHLKHLKPSGDFGDGFGAAGEDRPLLSEIFSNLPNLKTIQLRDFKGPSDTTRVRVPDFPELSWPASEAYARDEFNDHMFAVVLASLADANARPEHLGVIFSGFTFCLRNLAFYIPSQLEPSIGAAVFGLKHLDLSLNLDSEDHPANNALFVQRFLVMTPNLVYLRLRFPHLQSIFHTHHLLAWLGRHAQSHLHEQPVQGRVQWMTQRVGLTPSLNEPDPVGLPHLQQLVLENFIGIPETMMNLVTKFGPSLRTLKLDNTAYLVDLHNKFEHRVNIWTPLLKHIAEQCDLREWSIGCPRISLPHERRVISTYTIDLLAGGSGVVSYKGDDAKAMLKATADDISFSWVYSITAARNGGA